MCDIDDNIDIAYENLAIAIVAQAVCEYAAVLYSERLGADVVHLTGNNQVKTKKGKNKYEKFFESEWCSMLTSYSPETLKRLALKKSYELEDK